MQWQKQRIPGPVVIVAWTLAYTRLSWSAQTEELGIWNLPGGEKLRRASSPPASYLSGGERAGMLV